MGKYHLPDGETLVEELQCLVVYTPKDPVYRQALWGAISQLTKYWMWEPDGAGGEHDAADSWDLAYAATLESFGMLEELLGYVDEVEDLLRALEVVSTPCCDTDASDGLLFTDDVSDGTGDVPQNIIDAGYAADATDWAGFDDYKCMISHIVVDDMAGKLRAFAPYVDAAGTIAGGIASIIGIISLVYTGGASALLGGILGSTAAAATLYKNLVSGDFLSTLANKVDTNHEDLACAIYDGTDGPDEACSALKTKIDELFTTAEALVLKNLNICATIRALYAGRYDLDNIAQILADKGYVVGDFSCPCETPVSTIEWRFNSGLNGWTRISGNEPGIAHVASGGCTDDTEGTGYMTIGSQVSVRSPAFTAIQFNRIRLEYCHKERAGSSAAPFEIRRESDDATVFSISGPPNGGAWSRENEVRDVTLTSSQELYLEFQNPNAPDLDWIKLTFEEI